MKLLRHNLRDRPRASLHSTSTFPLWPLQSLKSAGFLNMHSVLNEPFIFILIVLCISQSAYSVELGRVVERGLRESRAIDTEALCIVAGEKVWSIRVDLHVLDHGGNLTDACSTI